MVPMGESELDALLESLREQRSRAIQGIDASNPDQDFADVDDVFTEFAPIDDIETYTLEVEFNDLELAVLTSGLMDPLSKASRADKVVYHSTLLIKLLEAAPTHVERMASLEAPGDDPRGFQ